MKPFCWRNSVGIYLLLCMAFAACVAVPLRAEENIVWEIGKFDGNYEEFAIPHDFAAYPVAFPDDVTYTVGKDDCAKSWPFIHPGPADGWAGARPHPFTIVFNMPEKPKGFYELRVGLVNTHDAMPPVLEIRVNDKADRIDLPAGASDDALTDASKGRNHEVNLSIPASFLRKGGNKIGLTIVHGSHLLYDALSLTNRPGVSAADFAIENVSITPTARFVRRNRGLKRLALLTADFTTAPEKPTATITINGESRKIRLSPSLFGHISADIELNDVDKPCRVEVTVQAGGQSKTASCEVRPARRWRLYMLPTSHVDIGYTDLQENVKVVHNNNTSLALDLCRKYPSFKWNTEVAWAEDNYLSMAPADRRDEFLQRAREGRIGCQAMYGNMLTGICSHEELIRSLYYAHGTAEKYGIPFDMAVSTDVPTGVWTLPSVLAGSGIRYFASGLNLVRAGSFNRLFNKPFYWEGPDGASVLTWLFPGYAIASSLGLTDSVARAGIMVDSYLSDLDTSDYPYDAVLGYGAFADNVPLDARLASVVDEWNRTYAYPKIILCRGPEFFRHIEKHFKDKIPTVKGDGGVYWEDGAGSSAYETALNRAAREDLVTAEKLFTLASAIGGQIYPQEDLAAAWKDAILYDEHTWGAARSFSEPEAEMTRKQWAYKANFARSASKAAASLKEQAFDRIARSIEVDEPSVVVFNPLGRPVSGVIKRTMDDGSQVEFIAEVPAMGFRVYPLKKVTAPAPAAPAGDTLENRFYQVEFDRVTGAVKRVYDKELGRELVDASAPYGLNQYVYFSGLGDAQKDATRDAAGPVSLSNTLHLGRQVMTVSGSAFNTPSWTAEVVLYDNEKRIDFLNTLDKNPTYEKEGGYFAFPFALSKPRFHIELPNGVVRPDKDMLDGGCMAWYCAQDFVAASDDGVSVVWTALDSPLITLCDVDHETADHWPLPKAASKWPSPLDNGHLYAYAFNNYWFTNYRASQSGKLQFRFSLTSMKGYDPVAASGFGQSVRNPLLAKVLQPRKVGGGRIPLSKSLCAVSPENVTLQAIKRAESGQGVIVRLREVGGKATRATVAVPAFRFRKAWTCNLVEDRLAEIPTSGGEVSVDIEANGMATVLLK